MSLPSQPEPAATTTSGTTTSNSNAATTGSDPRPSPASTRNDEHPRRVRQLATDVGLIVGFAAIVAATGLLPDIPTGVGVPYSLQTFAVLLSGASLGARRGFLAVMLYLAGGAIGLPIFAGGSSGIGHFAGVTAGYLIAFPLAAALCGWVVERKPARVTDFTFLFTAGLLSSFALIHTLGPLGIAWRADIAVREAFAADVVYFPGDVMKNVLMALVAVQLHRAFPDLLPPRHNSRRAQNR